MNKLINISLELLKMIMNDCPSSKHNTILPSNCPLLIPIATLKCIIHNSNGTSK